MDDRRINIWLMLILKASSPNAAKGSHKPAQMQSGKENNMITLTAQRLDDGIIEKAIIQLEQGEKVGFKTTYPNFTIRKNEQQEWYNIMSRKGYELYRIAFEGRDYSYVFFKKTA